MSERGQRIVLCAGLALVLGLAACGGAQAGLVAMNPPPRPLRSRAVAEVPLLEASALRGADAQARPHVEVGLIEVLGDDAWGASEQAAMRETLRRHGARAGCDAVALLGEIAWVDTVESSRATRVRHGYRGVCIVYR